MSLPIIPLLWSQHDDCHHSRKPEKGHHKCNHYGKFGHKIDCCYVLHGCPPLSDVVAHTDPPLQPSTTNPPSFVSATDKSAIINEFRKWSEDRKLSSSMTFVAHTGTTFAGLNQSSPIGPWVFDSGATYHITSKNSLFSSLSSPDNLPSVTMTNGSRVLAHGVGIVNLFFFLIHRSPFNLSSVSRLRCYLD